LILLGVKALPDVREGLHHSSADVRYHCRRFLDRYLEPETLGDLLDDADERVRISTLHTLACDRCKEGACRPNETEVLPRAMKSLASDRSPHVRAMAIEFVGQFVHANRTAETALLDAHSDAAQRFERRQDGMLPVEQYIVGPNQRLPEREHGIEGDNSQQVSCLGKQAKMISAWHFMAPLRRADRL
jgi:hypothetical protein